RVLFRSAQLPGPQKWPFDSDGGSRRGLRRALLKLGVFSDMKGACGEFGVLQAIFSGVPPGDCDGRKLDFSRLCRDQGFALLDRKSTRLNSSHMKISYAV